MRVENADIEYKDRRMTEELGKGKQRIRGQGTERQRAGLQKEEQQRNEQQVTGKALWFRHSRRMPVPLPLLAVLFALSVLLLSFLLPGETGLVQAAAADAGMPSADVSISAPGQQTGMKLSLHYGYQNTAKSGSYLPVSVEIGNHTEQAFSGVLELSVSEPGGDLVRYRYDAAAEAGQTVSVRATISVTDGAESVRLRLLDENGNVTAETEETLSVEGSADELLIGLLSNTPQELSYFRGLGISGTPLRTRTVSLNPSDFPETAEGLSQLDVILVSNYDMSRLTEENVRVLWEWTEGGGALLLGTGGEREPLGGLSSYLEGIEVGEPETRMVDMGVKYATESPDSASVQLSVRSVYLPEGIQVMQSGDLAVLTTISAGSGIVGIAAYDFCDIREFCIQQIAYPDELLKALLGNARLSQLAAASVSSPAGYETLSELVNMPDPARYPNMTVYFVIAAAYILLAGPGMYFLLRKNGLVIYYSFSVLLLSALAAAAIWFAGMRTRFEAPLVEYASLYERSEDKVSETEILNISTPLRKKLELSFAPDYLIQPVLQGAEQTDDAESAADRIFGSMRGKGPELVIGAEEGKRYLTAEGLRQFEPRLFALYRSGGETSDVPELSASLSYFDDVLSGSITNESGERLEDAALLMYGRIISVGTIEPGQTKDLSGYTAVYGPTDGGRLSADYITKADTLDSGQSGYAGALSKTRLLNWYLKESLSNYYNGARLVAFRTGLKTPASIAEGTVVSYGSALYTQTIPVDFHRGSEVYRSALSGEPKVVSGEYDADGNTMTGTAPVVLEYALGSDISPTVLKFNALSDEFSGKMTESGQRLLAFRGIRALYNYETGAYDTLSSTKDRLEGDELLPYLSPSNTVTVRYIPDENAENGSLMFLPVPTVTGNEK